jgi:hypothetical protein
MFSSFSTVFESSRALQLFSSDFLHHCLMTPRVNAEFRVYSNCSTREQGFFVPGQFVPYAAACCLEPGYSSCPGLPEGQNTQAVVPGYQPAVLSQGTAAVLA